MGKMCVGIGAARRSLWTLLLTTDTLQIDSDARLISASAKEQHHLHFGTIQSTFDHGEDSDAVSSHLAALCEAQFSARHSSLRGAVLCEAQFSATVRQSPFFWRFFGGGRKLTYQGRALSPRRAGVRRPREHAG